MVRPNHLYSEKKTDMPLFLWKARYGIRETVKNIGMKHSLYNKNFLSNKRALKHSMSF